jgi:DNA-binding NarL/FixJ family response regulator
MSEVRILLADDHEVVRRGTRLLLENKPGWKVCAEAANGREAVAKAAETEPDVVVLDIHLPELNGLDAIRQIKRARPRTEVLVFTGVENEQLVHDVFEAGARAFIRKSEIGSHLVAAVEALAQHRSYFTDHASEIVFARYLGDKSRGGAAAEPGSRLTAREREIVQLLAEGRSNKEVATALGISVKTAETHRAAIMRKLKFDSLAQIVRYAIRNHIIEA